MAEKANITRIKATDSAPKAASASKKAPAKKATAKAPKEPKEHSNNVLRRSAAYFKGAWVELKEVRWPNRQATWSLTLAVIAFSLLLTVLILALDALFKFLFQLIIA